MDPEFITNLFTIVAFGIIVIYLAWREKSLKDGQLEDAWEYAQKAGNVLKEVIAFMTPDDPIASTSKETISDVIPATAYKMSADAKIRILAQAADTEEKAFLINYIATQEESADPTTYTLTLKNGKQYLVQWGVPELIEEKQLYHLSQQQLADLYELCESENVPYFPIMAEAYATLADGYDALELKVGTKLYQFYKGEVTITT